MSDIVIFDQKSKIYRESKTAPRSQDKTRTANSYVKKWRDNCGDFRRCFKIRQDENDYRAKSRIGEI